MKIPDLSEFVAFVAEKSGTRKPSLIERDLLIHGILREINSAFGDAIFSRVEAVW